MKDFTKEQEKTKATDATQEKVGAVRCNTCNAEYRSFGVQPGDPCPNVDKPECTGSLMKTCDITSDSMKRRTDGAA